MSIQGAIVDMDGTLIDSNDAHARSWLEVLEEIHKPVPYGRVRSLIGMGADRILPLLLGIDEQSPEGRSIAARRSEIFREKYLQQLKPMSGGRELLKILKQHGLRICIGTSSTAENLALLAERAGCAGLFDEQTTKTDVSSSKPSPDVIQCCVRKLGLSPKDVLMIGDTPYDIEAAAGAGVSTVALRCGGWEDTALSGAIAIYNDPHHLVACFSMSPFAL
jgi:HAD superfamily hydrolase (TIGR01509 family)